jgi:hypothetical protein
MPWSQTPVVSWALATTHPGLLPSAACKASAFSHIVGLYKTTTIHISGLNTEPVEDPDILGAPLIHPASYSRYRACTWISLLIWWLAFDQVGLPR